MEMKRGGDGERKKEKDQLTLSKVVLFSLLTGDKATETGSILIFVAFLRALVNLAVFTEGDIVRFCSSDATGGCSCLFVLNVGKVSRVTNFDS